MAEKVGDMTIKVGEYEKDGETKGRYVNVGVLMRSDNGLFALLDPSVNLAGALIKQRVMNPQGKGDMVMCSVFEKRPRQESAPQSAPAAESDGFGDGIPFAPRESF